MPITLPATISAAKEQTPQLPGQPLLLAELTMIDGSIQRFSTHPLNATEGASSYTYGGHAYFARMQQQAFSSLQARSEQGIDRVDTLTLSLSDSDKVLFGIEKSIGFAGAIVKMRLVLWQADSNLFSSDSYVPFIGICDGPTYDQTGKGDVLQLTATSSHNMARIDAPVWQVQPTCGNDFALNASERQLGASDMSHHCFGCGYDPDQAANDPLSGTDARCGNTTTANAVNSYGRKIADASGNYIWCGKTRSDCEARGMFNQDSSSRSTMRFNGIEWAPQNREVTGKSYLDNKTIRFTQIGRNDAIFAERFPMLYGTQWVVPVIANVLGEPNSTRSEFVVCQDFTGNGQIGEAVSPTSFSSSGISQVVCNGVIVPPATSSPDKALFYCALISSGYRTGSISHVALYDGNGDPYGSLTTGVVVIYRQLAESGSAPNMQVLATGAFIKAPSDANPAHQASWPLLKTTNPCWVLLDVLIWSNWSYAEIDLQSFIDQAPYCDAAVTYTNLMNVTGPHARFKAQFVLQKARKASEVITGIKNVFNAQLAKDPKTGLLKLFIRKTLADQQPAAVTGSNYSTAVQSIHADGTSGNGYPAYLFDESVILRDSPDQPPKLRFYTNKSAQTANSLRMSFQDEDNSYSADSLAVKDADAINRAGGYQQSQEVPEDYNAIGFPNFDQAFRVGNTILAEKLRGNPGGDPRGTYFFGPFPVDGVRVSHLKCGDIVLLRWQAFGFQPATQLQSPPGTPVTGILCRVQQIDWTTNFQRAAVTLAWHEDTWYTDKYGQQGPPQYSNPRSGLPGRPPFPWQPFGVQPIAGDSVYGAPPGGYLTGSWWGFGAAQSYSLDANGNPLAIIAVSGCPPVNQLSTNSSSALQPPLAGPFGTSLAGVGGASIPNAMTLYFAAAAVDASGNESPLSAVWGASTPAGAGNDCTITSPTVYWQGGTSGWVLYGGTDSNNLSEQSSGSGTPTNITITSVNYETYGPPDPLADSLHFRAKRVIHGGVWGDVAVNVSTNTLQFTGAGTYTANQFIGYDLELAGMPQGSTAQIPLANFRVSANDVSGNFTVSPDPMTAVGGGQVPVGAVFIALTKPSTFTSNTIGDANFLNPYAPSGLNVNEGQFAIRIVAGKGMGQIRTVASNTTSVYSVTQPFDTVPDATSRFIVEDMPWVEDLDVERIVNATPALASAWNFNISNFPLQTILMQVNVQDVQGNSSLYNFAPLRMIYVWGAGLNIQTTTTATALTTAAQVIKGDTSSGGHTDTLPNPALVKGRKFTVKNIGPNPYTIQTPSGVIS